MPNCAINEQSLLCESASPSNDSFAEDELEVVSDLEETHGIVLDMPIQMEELIPDSASFEDSSFSTDEEIFKEDEERKINAPFSEECFKAKNDICAGNAKKDDGIYKDCQVGYHFFRYIIITYLDF